MSSSLSSIRAAISSVKSTSGLLFPSCCAAVPSLWRLRSAVPANAGAQRRFFTASSLTLSAAALPALRAGAPILPGTNSAVRRLLSSEASESSVPKRRKKTKVIDLTQPEELHRRKSTAFFRVLNPELFVAVNPFTKQMGYLGTAMLLCTVTYVLWEAYVYKKEQAAALAIVMEKRAREAEEREANKDSTVSAPDTTKPVRQPIFRPLEE